MACSALRLISTQRTTVARVTDGRRPPQQAAQGVEGRGSFDDERGARPLGERAEHLQLYGTPAPDVSAEGALEVAEGGPPRAELHLPRHHILVEGKQLMVMVVALLLLLLVGAFS